MTPRPTTSPRSPRRLRSPDVFALHLDTAPDPIWQEWADRAQIDIRLDGTAMLTARVRDQAELIGLILRIRDLGISLYGAYPACSLEPGVAW